MTKKPKRWLDHLPIGEIQPAERNPKAHHADLGASIGRFGYADAMILDERTGRLVAGHGRLEELQRRRAAGETAPDGIETREDGTWLAPVQRGWSSKSDSEAAAFLAAHNRIGEAGGWDDDELAKLIADLGDDERHGLGWDDSELSELLERLDPGPPSGTDPGGGEPPVDPVSKRGEVYELGPHRLICGDSTSIEDVSVLMAGRQADLMATDPPYGVAFADRTSEKRTIAGDLSQAAIPISFALAVDKFLSKNARLYLCGGSNNFPMYSSIFDYHLRQSPHVIVWDKTHFVLRPNNYHSQFELIYWGWKGSGGASWFGDRKQTDVWAIQRDPAASYAHPTQKPVEVFARMVRNSAPSGGVVYEPFAGSGSCLIACAQEGRVCRAVELEPGFADVIRKRWGDYARSAGIDPGPGAL